MKTLKITDCIAGLTRFSISILARYTGIRYLIIQNILLIIRVTILASYKKIKIFLFYIFMRLEKNFIWLVKYKIPVELHYKQAELNVSLQFTHYVDVALKNWLSPQDMGVTASIILIILKIEIKMNTIFY